MEEFLQALLSTFFIPGPEKLSQGQVGEIAVLQTQLVRTCFVLESASQV